MCGTWGGVCVNVNVCVCVYVLERKKGVRTPDIDVHARTSMYVYVCISNASTWRLQADWNAAHNRRNQAKAMSENGYYYAGGQAGDASRTGTGGGGGGNGVDSASMYMKDRLILDLQRSLQKVEAENVRLRVQVMGLKNGGGACGGGAGTEMAAMGTNQMNVASNLNQPISEKDTSHSQTTDSSTTAATAALTTPSSTTSSSSSQSSSDASVSGTTPPSATHV